jgi:hypothetical protein
MLLILDLFAIYHVCVRARVLACVHVFMSVFASDIACLHIQAHVTVYRSSCGFSLIRTAGSEVEARRRGHVQLHELGAWLQKRYRLRKVGEH